MGQYQVIAPRTSHTQSFGYPTQFDGFGWVLSLRSKTLHLSPEHVKSPGINWSREKEKQNLSTNEEEYLYDETEELDCVCVCVSVSVCSFRINLFPMNEFNI
eukprot:554873_1